MFLELLIILFLKIRLENCKFSLMAAINHQIRLKCAINVIGLRNDSLSADIQGS